MKNDSEESSEKQKCSHEIHEILPGKQVFPTYCEYRLENQKMTSLKYHLGPNGDNKGFL